MDKAGIWKVLRNNKLPLVRFNAFLVDLVSSWATSTILAKGLGTLA